MISVHFQCTKKTKKCFISFSKLFSFTFFSSIIINVFHSNKTISKYFVCTFCYFLKNWYFYHYRVALLKKNVFFHFSEKKLFSFLQIFILFWIKYIIFRYKEWAKKLSDRKSILVLDLFPGLFRLTLHRIIVRVRIIVLFLFFLCVQKLFYLCMVLVLHEIIETFFQLCCINGSR